MPERRLIPVYTTKGDPEAFMIYPYLFNRSGEWIGWVSPDREVYSVHGRYVGYVGAGPRILRKRSYSFDAPPKPMPYKRPGRITLPATIPLPPMMPELGYSDVDVLQDEPDRLPTIDTGEYRDDMD
jgi:hypothetical protein